MLRSTARIASGLRAVRAMSTAAPTVRHSISWHSSNKSPSYSSCAGTNANLAIILIFFALSLSALIHFCAFAHPVSTHHVRPYCLPVADCFGVGRDQVHPRYVRTTTTFQQPNQKIRCGMFYKSGVFHCFPSFLQRVLI